MAVKFYWYPKCSTCRNAKKWLEENDVTYEAIDIVKEPPSKEELLEMMEQSGLEEKKFFNTSGMKYRELNMKEKLPEMDRNQKAQVLSEDGMLIKRPLVYNGNEVTVGFKENEFIEKWLQK
ncbi:arsenate reductase family protein [Aciduricibacillus chroicocephali]|uniref:Arsenate reductase family protein n=1 Tax=Aciduricibacillus chroicocephali TaxID=3054939 RepID=A0ABY9KSM1_9BACI|nr:arsenate reductase family protein [Bacillaceae bacterium 44XB]